jgi:DNA ligase 1
MQFKTLYQKTKTGAINQWRIYTIDNVIYTEYGQVGGKLQTTCGLECIATNVGRSNERNPTQQAEFEAESQYKQQLRLKYSESIIDAHEVRIQPMLASDGKKAKLAFPVDIQRKYDGLRCLSLFEDGVRKLRSRGNKPYNIKHIERELEKIIPEDMMTDGELYIHGASLQQLNSLVRKDQLDSVKLEYHIYDMPGEGTWKERRAKLENIKFNNTIKFVETFTVNSIEEIVKLHDQFIQDGYEGAIVRLHYGVYEFGKRSRSLLKWKNFEDAEFEIVGISTGIGKMSECPIFLCKNDVNDLTFNVVPLGTMEARKSMLNDNNIGKLLTVKFIGRTEDNIPKFAVGKVIRIKEDF